MDPNNTYDLDEQQLPGQPTVSPENARTALRDEQSASKPVPEWDHGGNPILSYSNLTAVRSTCHFMPVSAC